MNVVAASVALLAPTNTTACFCCCLACTIGDSGGGATRLGDSARTPRGVGRKPSRLFREMTDTNKSHVLRPTPKVVLEQSKKYAMGALEHFNKRKKIKFELMDVMPVNCMPESCSFYTHVNFTARSSKEGSQEQLFFAELQLCSRRQASSGFIVTCCEPLGPDYTVGHKGFQHDGSVVRKNVDFTRCYACTARMLHPRGEKYIAGHCTIPYIYNSPY